MYYDAHVNPIKFVKKYVLRFSSELCMYVLCFMDDRTEEISQSP